MPRLQKMNRISIAGAGGRQEGCMLRRGPKEMHALVKTAHTHSLSRRLAG